MRILQKLKHFQNLLFPGGFTNTKTIKDETKLIIRYPQGSVYQIMIAMPYGRYVHHH